MALVLCLSGCSPVGTVLGVGKLYGDTTSGLILVLLDSGELTTMDGKDPTNQIYIGHHDRPEDDPEGDNSDADDGNGSDSQDPSGDTGNDSDSQDPSADTGDGSDNQDPSVDTGDGSDNQDPSADTADGSDSQDPSGDTGNGSDSQDPSGDTGNGSDSQDPSGDTGNDTDGQNPTDFLSGNYNIIRPFDRNIDLQFFGRLRHTQSHNKCQHGCKTRLKIRSQKDRHHNRIPLRHNPSASESSLTGRLEFCNRQRPMYGIFFREALAPFIRRIDFFCKMDGFARPFCVYFI